MSCCLPYIDDDKKQQVSSYRAVQRICGLMSIPRRLVKNGSAGRTAAFRVGLQLQQAPEQPLLVMAAGPCEGMKPV